MTRFIAAAVQAAPVAGDTAATVEKTKALIREAAGRGADVVVFPEAFIGGYPKGANFDIHIGGRTPAGRQEFADYHAGAIAVPGPETDDVAEVVREVGIHLTIGVIEREGGTLYCTALYFTPDGFAGKHRKLMPTAAERLCWGFGDGSTLDPVDTPWGPMGAVICWENYMPMMRMAMYGKRVAIYCAPTADDRDSWASTMRHIALEGRCFVISTCQYLTRADFPAAMVNRITDGPSDVLMRGGAIIIDPLGRVAAGPDYSGETILTAELDTDDVARAQFDFDVVGHYARPDVFTLIVNEDPQSPVVAMRTR
ncbi:MAG TPA: nitrilase-related carbon-nitrogen hydrolase [Shinella sp.]|uniref:nitrilase-related carbon-nitrogen hydrolase n=1 Tax=Shinella sp. TaxID=1870904 RepID=UPI0029AA8172|nr:nitrilase-related carbon-nitrogen hydrolase [Shinella sp.]MDX3975514.1 nitrilase-related carbon-nitrogen hydrolase [Shinella sp.]HEV7247532.1 nitrilase-related carbon-nitrogen hydrolase [Shinella sp.]